VDIKDGYVFDVMRREAMVVLIEDNTEYPIRFDQDTSREAIKGEVYVATGRPLDRMWINGEEVAYPISIKEGTRMHIEMLVKPATESIPPPRTGEDVVIAAHGARVYHGQHPGSEWR
jgi:hypothetical protein